jgi:hypothetical protein
MKNPNLDLKSISESIVDDIINDLSDRGGLSDEWDQIDNVTVSEIKTKWEGIVEEYLVRYTLLLNTSKTRRSL